MVAGAILTTVAAAVLMTMSYSASATAKARVRAIASSEAQTALDRMMILSGINDASNGTDALRCSLFQAAGGPMDATTGATVTGSCPTSVGDVLTVSDIPIPKSTLKRTVEIESQNIGAAPGLVIRVSVSGAELPTPILITSHIRR